MANKNNKPVKKAGTKKAEKKTRAKDPDKKKPARKKKVKNALLEAAGLPQVEVTIKGKKTIVPPYVAINLNQ